MSTTFYVRSRERGKPDNLDKLTIDERTCRATEGPQGWTVRGYATEETIEAMRGDLVKRDQRVKTLTEENDSLLAELQRRGSFWSGLFWGVIGSSVLWAIVRGVWG